MAVRPSLTKTEPAAATNSDGLLCLFTGMKGYYDDGFLQHRLSKINSEH